MVLEEGGAIGDKAGWSALALGWSSSLAPPSRPALETCQEQQCTLHSSTWCRQLPTLHPCILPPAHLRLLLGPQPLKGDLIC